MVVIPQNQQLLTRVASCLRLDKKDKTVLHVEIDAVMAYLSDYDIPVAPRQYEEIAIEMLNSEVVGKVKLGNKGALEQVATLLIVLAVNMLEAAEFSAQESYEIDPPDIMTDGS